MAAPAPDLLLEHVADPYPYYRALRDSDPVHFDERRGNWLILRYDDVLDALRDDVRLSAQQGEPNSMLLSDPPRHTRLRGLVSQAFTPRRVRELAPRIHAIVDELLDEAAARSGMEVVADFAYALPITVIAELLGVDKEQRAFFRDASEKIALALGGTTDNAATARAAQSSKQLRAYFEDLIARRRADPRDDLVTACIAAEERGDLFTHIELLAMLSLLLVGGHETTANLIGNGLLALLSHPGQLELLRKEDIGRLAVDELLRYDSPVQYTGRVAKEDFELEGKTIRAGDGVRVMLGSANRDERRFADPDALDLRRDPCPHLSFGWGAHFCLGAELARLEGEIALTTIVRRFPRLALTDQEVTWRPATVMRGLQALPVTV
ncbi:MAG: cytochrome P450 [Tepidiformaceae bacterium]